MTRYSIVTFGLIISAILFSCSEHEEDAPTTLTEGKSIYVSNFTGHLVRRSGTRCGEGINVEFVLSSDEDSQTYQFEPDSYKFVVVQIQRGQELRVSAYEVIDNTRNLLTRSTMVYDPPNDADRAVRPEIVLCPKDRLEFYDFN